MAYVTPKTDWEATDNLTHDDYNRIKNNLVYINDLFNHMYDNPYTFEPGPDMEIDQMFKASTWNMFEDCVEHLKRSGREYDFGERSYYYDNGHLPDFNQLNRLERCIEAYAETDIPVTGVSLAMQSYKDTVTYNSLPASNRIKLTPIFQPANASNQNVTWTSSDTNVVTIDTSGNVTAIGGGSATITVTTEDGGYTATMTYYVIISAGSLTIGNIPLVNVYQGNVNPPTSSSIPSEDIVYVEDYLTYNSHANYVRVEVESQNTTYLKVIEMNNKHNLYGDYNEFGPYPNRTVQITVKLYQDPDGTVTTPSYTATKNVIVGVKLEDINPLNTDKYIGGFNPKDHTIYPIVEPSMVEPVLNKNKAHFTIEDPSCATIVNYGVDSDGYLYVTVRGVQFTGDPTTDLRYSRIILVYDGVTYTSTHQLIDIPYATS